MQVATEDIPDTRLRAALDSGRYTATSAIDEVERFNVALISVPTPLKEGIPDLFDVGGRPCEAPRRRRRNPIRRSPAPTSKRTRRTSSST
jgi:hypothetical protein